MASHVAQPTQGNLNVSDELNQAVSGLTNNQGALEALSAPGGLSSTLAYDNTQMNIGNIADLSSLLVSPQGGGLLPEYNAESQYLGNSFLGNVTNQIGANIGNLTSEQLAANPFVNQNQQAASNAYGMGSSLVSGASAGLAGIGQQQVQGGASALSSLSGIGGQQAAAGMAGAGVLGSLGGQMTAEGSSVNPFMSAIAGIMGTNPQSATTQQTNQYVGNQLGQLSPDVANNINVTQQQLALGGNISQQEQDMVSQASRSADSARGIFDSNASVSNELLNLDQYSQQRLMARENQANAASSQGMTQIQNEAGNAMTMSGINQQSLFNMLSGSANVANQGLQTQLSQQEAGANTANAGVNAMLSGLSGQAGTTAQGYGSLLSGLAGASGTGGQVLGAGSSAMGQGLNQLAQLLSLGGSASQNSMNTIQQGLYNGPGVGSNLMSGSLSSMYGGTANPTPTLFNSMNLFPAAVDNNMTNYNAQFAANAMNAQANNSLTGGIISGVSNIVGSLLGGVGKMCWVAREAFGEDSPQWKQFRTWLLTEAPEEFAQFYATNGLQIADEIHDNPKVKELIKYLMTAVLNKRR